MNIQAIWKAGLLPKVLWVGYLIFLASTVANAADEEFEISILARQGMLINLEHSFGNLEVRQGNDNQVKITGSKSAESGNQVIAQEFLDEIELKISEGSNQINITTFYPNIGFSLLRRNKVTNREMSYTIEIPLGTKLDVALRFGDIDLNGLSGDVKVDGRQAIIQALELRGDVSVRNANGSVIIESIDGSVEIDANDASVSVSSVSGDLVLRNKFGSSEIRNVQGSVRTSGEITPIFAEGIGGNLNVDTYASTVIVNGVDQNVDVSSKEAEVIVTNIQGDVKIENREGSIAIDQVGGNISVDSVIGPVTIRNANEDIVVNGRSTDLTLEQVFTQPSDRPRLMDLTTSLGFLKLELSAGISASLNASTVRRQIHANFPVSLRDSAPDSPSISAEFGDMKDMIIITGTENVEITLTKL